jgi:hypothetical protein
MDPDITVRTLAELELLHARVERLEFSWSSMVDKAKDAYHSVVPVKTPHAIALALVTWAEQNKISGTSGSVKDNIVEMTINDKAVTITVVSPASFLINMQGNEPAHYESLAQVQGQLGLYAKSKGVAAPADIRAYSAAIRAQLANNPYPRAALY